jgi:hypothetical protein
MTQITTSNISYVQLIGPLYLRDYSLYNPVMGYTITSIFTKPTLEESDLNDWNLTLHNIIYNTGSYVEKTVLCVARFFILQVFFRMFQRNEFGYYTKISFLSNIRSAGLMVDVLSAMATLLYDDAYIEHTLAGATVGVVIGMPHISALIYTYAKPNSPSEYIGLTIPVVVIATTGQFSTKFGVEQSNHFLRVFDQTAKVDLADLAAKKRGLAILNIPATGLAEQEEALTYLLSKGVYTKSFLRQCVIYYGEDLVVQLGGSGSRHENVGNEYPDC